MGFFTELEKTQNITSTENGDIAYHQVLAAGDVKNNLRFFGLGGAMRGKDTTVKEMFGKAFLENEELAIANLLYLRDLRGGKGERKLFRACLEHLADVAPEKTESLLPLILEYGRGDDLLVLVEKLSTRQVVCDYICKKIKEDLDRFEAGETVSLLAKWMPKPNATAKHKRELARIIAAAMGMSEGEYRRVISKLRSRLNLVETALTQKKPVDYATVPSQAMMKHTGQGSFYAKNKLNAFPRNDKEAYQAYVESLVKGESKVNAATLNPVQVYKRAFATPDLSQAQWNEIEERVPATDKRIIIVRDGSGSMIGDPLAIATSLTILASGSLTGEFKDKFITFSHEPRLVDLSGCGSLADKRRRCEKEADCSNTNIEATYDLILETSKHCAPADYITNVVVISDMQFDMGTGAGDYYDGEIPDNISTFDEILQYSISAAKNRKKPDNASTFAQARKKFEEAGVPFPTMTYWNVAARNLSFPTDTIDGVQFVSGYSDAIYADILKNGSVDAVEFMLKTLERYRKCTEAVM